GRESEQEAFGYERGHGLLHAPRALGCAVDLAPARDEHAAPGAGLDDSLAHQLAIGARYRVGIDHQLLGEAPDARQRLILQEAASQRGGTDLLDDLPIERNGAAGLNREGQWHSVLVILVHYEYEGQDVKGFLRRAPQRRADMRVHPEFTPRVVSSRLCCCRVARTFCSVFGAFTHIRALSLRILCARMDTTAASEVSDCPAVRQRTPAACSPWNHASS